jgi:hypothetical protein
LFRRFDIFWPALQQHTHAITPAMMPSRTKQPTTIKIILTVEMTFSLVSSTNSRFFSMSCSRSSVEIERLRCGSRTPFVLFSFLKYYNYFEYYAQCFPSCSSHCLALMHESCKSVMLMNAYQGGGPRMEKNGTRGANRNIGPLVHHNHNIGTPWMKK